MTKRELDKILEHLPEYWKKTGEKRMIENAYRYMMLNEKMRETSEGKIAFDYAAARVVKIWCRETDNDDAVWMRGFIENMFKQQLKSTPAIADLGKDYAEFLVNLFKAYPDAAKMLLEV